MQLVGMLDSPFVNSAAPAIANNAERPALTAFSAHAEQLPEFLACPL
jgi:hypothetical protein